ncbi:MAG: CPBP family intramembrane glutamic endopeptidase [Peptoniphilus harei]|uniref:CPBP family intramembrane glutamic endopeptidase n=1 Tax=Peptoniphilus harei TaxID=54005 RepID=UPI002901905B|nr:CPBP family intramembrane glutamic endopeptidase [Peptoniphilus harei]MDU2373569.1 CPBP family intramembrane glutamic endopeptidase [Peptoniphilus harei]
MTLAINKIINSLLEIILFSLLPFLFWCFSARKQERFTDWIGLKKIKGAKKTALAIILVTVFYLAISLVFLKGLNNIESATSEFQGLGFAALPAIFIYAVFNTSFPEEILFRGFILKRLANKLGFTKANFIQGLIFGLLHGVMFFPLVGNLKTILIILLTSLAAFAMGYVNEEISGGSIIPSWIIHAISNFIAGIYLAFYI